MRDRENAFSRRILSSSLSARVVDYLRRRGHSQAKIARMLGVSEGFISLVKSRERSLTIDHLERLSLEIGVPLGAFLLAATRPKRKITDPRKKELFELSEQVIKKADAFRQAIMYGGVRAKTTIAQ